MNIDTIFPKGIFASELLIGSVNTISSNSIHLSLPSALHPSASFYQGGRYGRGEVGEFVLIEGQVNIIFGRLVDVRLEKSGNSYIEAVGKVQLLGSISMENLKVTAGIESYPRLGDNVYSAPHQLISMIPRLMCEKNESNIQIEVGSIDVAQESKVSISPEKLFGRHLAILGSTGGGKSWSISSIIEQSLKFNSKIILLDATGEFRNLIDPDITHTHLSNPVLPATYSKLCSLPPTAFQESDFIALFEPSGKIQGPKLKEAIKSLRLAKLSPKIFLSGYVPKINQSKDNYNKALNENNNIDKIDNPATPFDVKKLTVQIKQECVYPNGFNGDDSKWGGEDNNYSYCLSLITRINSVLESVVFKDMFQTPSNNPSLIDEAKSFFNSDKKLLRIDLSGISFEYKAREIISNAIGRYLLKQARSGFFKDKPLIVFVDEAHNFLGKNIGNEDTFAKLDAFELIAKEGRKFGLNICLSTQRPRDITEDILSQVGTMIIHRLTNDRDREIIERACGEIDRSVSMFLPSLKPGEAIVVGADFPIPLTVQIAIPQNKPESSGANFQASWA